MKYLSQDRKRIYNLVERLYIIKIVLTDKLDHTIIVL